MEDRNQILATRTNDVKEGGAAFLEKREPRYEDTWTIEPLSHRVIELLERMFD